MQVEPTVRAPVRVFLADDHHLVRSGLKALIDAQEDMSVIGEAGDGQAALDGVTTLQPNVVVMDVSMPKLGGSEATERILAKCPGVRVLALTAHEEASYLNQILSAGASGCMLKRAAAEDLVHAIRAVAAGGVYLDPGMASQLTLHPGTKASGPHLSDRESEVLRMIAEGHAMKEIAGKLEISPRTLETYRARAMDKLGLKSRADIVQYARKRGWFEGH